MKIAILGYGSQGQSAYEYWASDNNEVTVCDQDETLELPDGIKRRLGTDYLKDLNEFDLLVRTPLLHPSAITDANPDALNILEKVTTNTNEFFKACPSKNIIGVTGTKGKGTTSTLIAKMLETAGHRVHLGGNIGIPPLELLKDTITPEDFVVLELANFQLIDLKHSPPLAVCLLVEPEHLDWHEDIQEYIAAKQQLFRWQQASDKAVFYSKNSNSKDVVSVSAGQKIPYFDAPGALVTDGNICIGDSIICRTDELRLLGEHNWQNVCAAVTAVWQVTQDVSAISKAATEFSGLPFRIELRREVNGVRFYNDSFATNPEATIAALRAVPGKKVMILGGYERGLDLASLAHEIKQNESTIRHTLLIGASAERIAKSLATVGFDDYTVTGLKDMSEIVKLARERSEHGDAVVFSPAFASFDMFKNFEERGKAFNQAVASL